MNNLLEVALSMKVTNRLLISLENIYELQTMN